MQLLERIVRYSFFAKWLIYSFHSLMPIHQNHFWRQFDTLGVSIRYFQRFFLEHRPEPFLMKFLPAILQSGDASGITPMEFPLLNLITAPLWLFGPKWGRIFCSLFLVSLCYSLCYFLYKKLKHREGLLFLLVPFISFTAENIYKFIPDVLASLLVCISIVFALERRFLWAILLCATGALMKPPALAALFLLILFRKSLKECLRLDSGWTAVAAGFGFLYYTLGVRFIQSFGDTRTFAIAPRNPLQAFADIAKMPDYFFGFLNTHAVYWGGGYLLASLLIFAKKPFQALRILGVIALSILFVIALDGTHSIVHDYYYSGAAFAICWLTLHALGSLPSRNRIHGAVLGLFLVSTFLFHPVELMIHDFHALPKVLTRTTIEDDCEYLIRGTPSWPWNQHHVFRSDALPYPKLGVCFRERVGSKTSRYGFFLRDAPIPADCKPALQRGEVVLVECATNSPTS